jgi:hypothetical protein
MEKSLIEYLLNLLMIFYRHEIDRNGRARESSNQGLVLIMEQAKQ